MLPTSFRVTRNRGSLDVDNWLLCNFSVMNLRDTELTSIRFVVKASDAFGELIFQGEWNIDQVMSAGQLVTTPSDHGFELSHFVPEHLRLMKMEASQLSLQAITTHAAFADGQVFTRTLHLGVLDVARRMAVQAG